MPTAGIIDASASRELRRAVLRPHLDPAQPLPGDDLPGAVHLGTVDEDGTVTCTCFVYPDPCPWRPGDGPAWHLRQMATLPGRRGAGLGTAVVAAALAHVEAAGARLLWCNARETAVGFYARLGFRGHGEIFTDDRHPIPHLGMWRELAPPAASSSSTRRSAGAR